MEETTTKQEQMRSQTIGALAAALAAAQGEMEGAKKDSDNPFFKSKYADLASVWDAIRGPLSKNGLAVIQKPSSRFIGTPEPFTWVTKAGEERHGVRVPTEIVVTTTLMHASGEFDSSAFSCLLDTADPQAVGSAVSYLRRYGLQAIAGVAPEDDDAEGAQGRQTPAGKSARADDDPTANECRAAAAEVAAKTKSTVAEVLKRVSTFEGKDGKQMYFTDPAGKSQKWVNGVLHKLRDELAALELGPSDDVLNVR